MLLQKQWKIALGPCTHMGDLKTALGFGLLGPGCCGHLGGETVDGKSIEDYFFLLSLFLC